MTTFPVSTMCSTRGAAKPPYTVRFRTAGRADRDSLIVLAFDVLADAAGDQPPAALIWCASCRAGRDADGTHLRGSGMRELV
jgi:hypothetical protein